MLDLIERKAAGEEIAVQPEAEEPAAAPDLMAALEASLAPRSATRRTAKKPRSRSPGAAPAQAPGAARGQELPAKQRALPNSLRWYSSRLVPPLLSPRFRDA